MSDATSLGEALLAVQRAMPAIQKDAINPHYRNRYVSLESLMPSVLGTLNENGVVLTQFPTGIDTGSGVLPALRTRLTHAASGEYMEDAMLLMSSKDDPQGQGAALTYARRYALMAILGLVADEDEDGEATKRAAGDAAPPATTGGQEALSASREASPPPSPAAAAQAAYEASRTVPEDDGDPANVICTFGKKHKDQRLGDIPQGYLEWIVDKFEARNSEQRRIVEAAAMLLGRDVSALSPPDDDIPF